jgi:hypothetical protein
MIKLLHKEGQFYQLQIDKFFTEVMAYEEKGILKVDCICLSKPILRQSIGELPDNLSLVFDLGGDDSFNFIEIEKKNGTISFFFLWSINRLGWHKDWSERIYLTKLAQNLALEPQLKVISQKSHNEFSSVCVQYLTSERTIREACQNGQKLLAGIVKTTELELKGFAWKSIYFKNERVFSIEFIRPLLLKLGFSQVRYNHGKREYGKDFTFIDEDMFGQKKSYALQVKVGNVRGNVKSQIDDILGQIEDAFSMPYFDIGSKTLNIFPV